MRGHGVGKRKATHAFCRQLIAVTDRLREHQVANG